MRKVLVIEDDEIVRDVLRLFFGKKGFEVTLTDNGEAGAAILRTARFDLILTGFAMPRISGMDVLKEVVACKTSAPVIVMTASGTVRTAVEAMRHGAFDYITRPVNLDELTIVLEKALYVSKLQKENVTLKMQLKKKYRVKGLINGVPVMQTGHEQGEKITAPVPRRSTTGNGDNGVGLNEMMRTMERRLILQALEQAGGVKSEAARLLGLNRTTLLEKIKKMGIETQKK